MVYQTPDEPVFVTVLGADGRWHEGFLEHWRRDGDRWRAFVRYNVGPGMNHIDWVDQDEVRPVPLPGHGTGPAPPHQTPPGGLA